MKQGFSLCMRKHKEKSVLLLRGSEKQRACDEFYLHMFSDTSTAQMPFKSGVVFLISRASI